ncbi:MAG: 4Fe-4S dicluster domain-containing protein [Methanomassiliicoccales archaeon]
MRTSSFDPELPEELIQEDFAEFLRRCHQCGQCSSVCPSLRNGGIRPREVMERAITGTFELETDRSIWLCTMCNGCSERCEMGVNPAGVINALRRLSAQRGGAPDHLLSEVKLFKETGLAFPRTRLTSKLRGELDLEELEVDADTQDELDLIVKRTSMGRLPVER